jgi:hypothetical protein
MELNALLFPSPKVEYTAQDLEGEVAYIPRHYKYNETYIKVKKDMENQIEEHETNKASARKHATLADTIKENKPQAKEFNSLHSS